jgi:hypothetical protein
LVSLSFPSRAWERGAHYPRPGTYASKKSPGIYQSISASGSASLTLNPGVYLIEGGGFTVTVNAGLSGTGVTFYNTSSTYPSSTGSYGGITLSGNGTFSLTAPTSGPYAGVVIFQPSANTRALSLSGNAAQGLGGTVYAPAALVSLSVNATVNGALVVNQLSGQLGRLAADLFLRILGVDLLAPAGLPSGLPAGGESLPQTAPADWAGRSAFGLRGGLAGSDGGGWNATASGSSADAEEPEAGGGADPDSVDLFFARLDADSVRADVS